MGTKTYLGTTINPSPTVVFPANAAITGARCVAVTLTGGKLALPSAGASVLGISIGETDDNVAANEDITVQIKDIGKWIAGEAIAAGDELATNAAGKAVKATAGDFVVGVALTAAAASGSLVQVQISKSGYKPAASASMSLSDLSDVDVSGKGDGKVLKYSGTSSKWEAAADATE